MKLLIALFLITNSFAADKALEGYAFDFASPEKSQCRKEYFKVISKIYSLECFPGTAAYNFGGAAKTPFQVCQDKKKSKTYLFYTNEKDCKEARETELSNGD